MSERYFVIGEGVCVIEGGTFVIRGCVFVREGACVIVGGDFVIVGVLL